MDSLPTEILKVILTSLITGSSSSKNDVLPLRLVCKDFNALLREDLLKTVQLDFSRLSKLGEPLDFKYVDGLGEHCEAIHADFMVMRDQEEITRLETSFTSIIEKLPEIKTQFNSLHQYCMSDITFHGCDFKDALTGILLQTPNSTRFKLNLPFQFVGKASYSATILCATAFKCLAECRGGSDPEFSPIDTLVLGHLSDTTILDIYKNPIDLHNTIKVFTPLKHLVMSIKRQESDAANRNKFTAALWRFITEATNLESLCLIGWNSKRTTSNRKHLASFHATQDGWSMRSLPYRQVDNGARNLKHLRSLELKRVDVEPTPLLQMIEHSAASLKELYLNEVYLKVNGRPNEESPLWIGHGPEIAKPHGAIWISEELRSMASRGLKLDTLRATALGYEENPSRTHIIHSSFEYDLQDPSGRNRSFDERFVERALGLQPSATVAARPEIDYDVDAYQQYHNTTSDWNSSLDGIFYNHNDKALEQLRNLITIIERGMTLLSDEIERISTMTHFDRVATTPSADE